MLRQNFLLQGNMRVEHAPLSMNSYCQACVYINYFSTRLATYYLDTTIYSKLHKSVLNLYLNLKLQLCQLKSTLTSELTSYKFF